MLFRSPEALARQIQHLLTDETARQAMAQNGKDKTLTLHTWSKRAEQFLEILQERI